MNTQAKIVWGVSPLEKGARPPSKALESISKVFAGLHPEIQPVTVVPAGLLKHGDKEDVWKEIAATIYRNLEQKIKGHKVSNLLPARLLRVEGSASSDTVACLIQFALEEGADVIAVDSHNRKGLEKIFMGSFAETLVLQSPLPVLVFNPRTQTPTKLKRILYPTDFSEASHEVFMRIAKLAAKLNVPIYLFHKLYFARPELVGMPFVFPAIAKESIKEVKQAFLDKGKEWADHAKGFGVRVKVHLDTQPGPALDEILKTIKRMGGSTLVAMASQSGPVKSVLLGSLTRQILRHSTCPVVVLHAEQESRIKEFLVGAENFAYSYSAHPLIR